MLSFFKWMNKQHPSITFTKEEEQDNKLSFLDVLLTRTTDGSIVESIYRKPTFSGLYVKWDSFVPKSYKKGLVNCLVFRPGSCAPHIFCFTVKFCLSKSY